MSSAFSLLSGFNSSKPYSGFKNLAIGYYEIESFRFVKNKMYNENNEEHVAKKLKRVLLVELKEEVLFLPEYFAVPFNDDDSKIDELNNDGVKKYLYFGGQRPSNK